MSENIVITEGIKEPWELKGTDYDKPEEIVLVNLAVGQLAFIGSAFGGYLSRQATVTAELAEAVNRVRERSAEVTSLFANWNTESPKLDIVMPATGAYPIEPSIVDLKSATPSSVDKLVIANNVLAENNIANNFIPPLNPDVNVTFPEYCTYTFGPVAGGQTITGFSPQIAFYEVTGDFQLYLKKDAGGVYDTAKKFVLYKGVEYEVQNIKPIWVPRSASEINYFNNQLSLVNAANNSRLLTDSTQLVPVPSEINNSTPSGAETMQQPPVTMELAIADADFLEFKLEGGGYFYYDKPVSQIPKYDANTVANNVGSVVQMEDKTYRYVVRSERDVANPYMLIKTTVKPCIKDPTNLEQSGFLSQYSEKIVRITQRSTEQTTYVNALTQRYNYYFEAATNILKAFTNLWATLSSNI